MNEPPVDSLPSWQMAQDRQGIGESGEGSVVTCVFARE